LKKVLWFLMFVLLASVASADLGYEFLDGGVVLHMWNDIDDYYINRTNGMQLTNHYQEYWTRNAFCLGYETGGEWEIITCTDELEGWGQSIEQTDDYIFAYIWNDVNLLDYDMRLAIGYKIYKDQWEMEVIPYMKNLDEDPILAQVGFIWELRDIRIAMGEEDNQVLINRSMYDLSDDLDLWFTNMKHDYSWWDNATEHNETIYEPFYRVVNDQEFLKLEWDHQLDYGVRVKSRPGQYNAPIALAIRAGQFQPGQEKNTTILWIDALDDDIRAYWSMDDADTNDISCEDLVGTNNGTLKNGVESGKTCQIDECYYFDGADDYIVVPDDAVLDLGTNDFSISAWINLTNNGEVNTALLDKRVNGGAYTGYYLYYQNHAGYDGFRTQVNGVGISDVGEAVKADGDMFGTGWHHIVWVVDRDTAANSHLYFDGVALDVGGRDQTAQQGSLSNAIDLKIGQDVGGTSKLEGAIEEVGIWDRVLTPTEVVALASLQPPFPIMTGANITLTDPSDNYNLSANGNWSLFSAEWNRIICDNMTLYINNTANYTRDCTANMSFNVSFDVPGSWDWDVLGCKNHVCNYSSNGNWSVFMDNISGLLYRNITLTDPPDNFNLSTNGNWSLFNATWDVHQCDNMSLYINGTVNFSQDCTVNMSHNVSFDVPGSWDWDVRACNHHVCNYSWNGNRTVFMDNISGRYNNQTGYMNITLTDPPDNFNLSANGNWSLFNVTWETLICTNMTLEFNNSANYTQNCSANMSFNVSFDVPGSWDWDVRACKDDICNYSWNGNRTVFMDNISGLLANYSTWVNMTLSAPSTNYNLSANANVTTFEANWTNLICTNMSLYINGTLNFTQDCTANMSHTVSFDVPGSWDWDVRVCKDNNCNYSWNGNWSVFMDNISGRYNNQTGYMNITLWSPPNNTNMSLTNITTFKANWTNVFCDNMTLYINNTANYTQSCVANLSHTVSFATSGYGIWDWDVRACKDDICNYSLNGNWSVLREELPPYVAPEYAGLLTTWCDGSSAINFTYIHGTEWPTLCLNVPRNVVVNNAYFMFKGYSVESNVTLGENVTTYSGYFPDTVTNPENANDGDFNTYSTSPNVGSRFYYLNFSVSPGTTEINLSYKMAVSNGDVKILCQNTSNLSQWLTVDTWTGGVTPVLTTVNTGDYCHADNQSTINFWFNWFNVINPNTWVNYDFYISTLPKSYPTNVTIYLENTTQIYTNASVFDGVAFLNITSYVNNSDLSPRNFSFGSNTSGILEVSAPFLTFYNVLNITIYDEESENLITDLIDVNVKSATSETNYTTATGNLFLEGKFDGEYTVSFSSGTYGRRDYALNFVGYESLNLVAFLTSSNETVTLTFKDDGTQELLEGVSVIMQRMIDDTWQTVNSKLSDVTGKVQFLYAKNERYRFLAVFDDYATKVFVLDPILFETYTVLMQRSEAYSEDIDYFGVVAIHSPHQFFNDREHELTFLFSSPEGILESYGFNISYLNGSIITQSRSGTNAQGESWDLKINISDAEITDRVVISWYYDSTLGGLREFRQIYTINDYTPNSGTWLYNQRETYGMGLLERVLICVLIAIIVGGFLTLVAGAEIGGGVGLMVMGFIAYVLAINVFLILLSLLIGFFIIARRSSD